MCDLFSFVPPLAFFPSIQFVQFIFCQVHRYFGAANKNIGCAFLMAWKICNGRLFGLKDPRDEDQTKCSEQALAKGRAGVCIRSKGFGSVDKELTPCELIDASLVAFVKSHYDVHNANLKGGKFEEFNKRLQSMAENGSMHPDDVKTFEKFQATNNITHF